MQADVSMEMPPPAKPVARKRANGRLGQKEAAPDQQKGGELSREDSDSLFVPAGEEDVGWDPTDYDDDEESMGWDANVNNASIANLRRALHLANHLPGQCWLPTNFSRHTIHIAIALDGYRE